MTCRKLDIYLDVVYFFTTRDLNSTGTEIFPDERTLFGFKEGGDVSFPLYFGA
jgi:hypothetical protein